MKIGYVRVSKQEQHEALQIDALKKAAVTNGLWTTTSKRPNHQNNYTDSTSLILGFTP